MKVPFPRRLAPPHPRHMKPLLPTVLIVSALGCCGCALSRPPTIFNQVHRFRNADFPARVELVFPHPGSEDFSIRAKPVSPDATPLRFDCLYMTNIVVATAAGTNIHSYAYQFWSSGHVACYHMKDSPSDLSQPLSCWLGYFELHGDSLAVELFSNRGYQFERSILMDDRLECSFYSNRPWHFGPFTYGWEEAESVSNRTLRAVPYSSFTSAPPLRSRQPFW